MNSTSDHINMADHDNSPPGPPDTTTTRVRLAIAVLVTYVCLFNGLTAFGLVGPDEPRYAAIARDMAVSDDWVTPRLHGEPWLEKPILYYWVAAVGYRVFGDSEWAARLPSVAGAATSMLALGWLARRFYGGPTAALFVLLFPSSIAILVFARAATTDMLFSATLALALASSAPLVLLRQPRGTLGYQIGFGAALGLAVLAKGPAGVVLAGSAIVIGALLARRLPQVWRLAGPWSLGTFALVALPWYVLCALRNPEFIQVFLISHNVERFLTPVFQHQQPFWYFAPVLLLGLAPWTAAIVATVYAAATTVTRRDWVGSPSMFLAGWVIFPVVFFSLSQSKLPGYVLPAMPAAIVLLARALALAMTRPAAARAVGLGTAAVLAVMAVAFLVSPGVASAGVEAGAVRPLGVLLSLATVATGYVGSRGRIHAGVAVAALTIALGLWQLNATLMPRLDPGISTRVTAREARHLADGEPVRTYALHRAWQYGLEYYLHRALPEWTSDTPSGALVVTNQRGMRAMQLEGAGIVVLRNVSADAMLVRTDPNGERLTIGP
ncbi:MAG: glycosyltransferase family 39 protein [Acidobacteriota bacterium]|nr:glycosyltransferase family 39 protein [Acidobacteriota bacterium]